MLDIFYRKFGWWTWLRKFRNCFLIIQNSHIILEKQYGFLDKSNKHNTDCVCMHHSVVAIYRYGIIYLIQFLSCSRQLQDGDIINVDVTVSWCLDRHANKLKDITANANQSEQHCSSHWRLPIRDRCIWMVTMVTPQRPSWLARWMRLGSDWWKQPGAAEMRPSLPASRVHRSV